jgi:hypothetical protein
MTLSNHRVTVVYTGDGASAALAVNGDVVQRPGLAESLELFEPCQIREVVERDALPSGQRSAIRPRVQPMDRETLVGVIAGSDVVIAW